MDKRSKRIVRYSLAVRVYTATYVAVCVRDIVCVCR
jgi:hypothetical protein